MNQNDSTLSQQAAMQNAGNTVYGYRSSPIDALRIRQRDLCELVSHLDPIEVQKRREVALAELVRVNRAIEALTGQKP
jgi:hypothetical protein